jgi:hypothetical protein
MKKVILHGLALTCFFWCACGSKEQTPASTAEQTDSGSIMSVDSITADTSRHQADQASASISDPLAKLLKESVGKRPQDILLLEHPDLKMRMFQMMGADESDYLKMNWEEDETIIEKEGRYVIATGFKHQNRNKTAFHLIMDTETAVMHILMKKEGKNQYFSERGEFPESLKKL